MTALGADERAKSRRAAALVAAATAAMSLSLAACQRSDGEQVDLGPQASIQEILAAIGRPTESVDYSATTQPGSFAHWQDVQTIAAAYSMVVADTGQTVDERDESADPSYVWFNVLERKFSYVGDETREVATERPMRIPRRAPPSATARATATAIASAFASPSDVFFNWIPLARPWSEAAQALGAPDSPFFGTSSAATPSKRVTFHALKTSIERTAPPEKVRARPDCGGVSGCLMSVHTVEFDQVAIPGTDRPFDKIHYKFKLSPDVPFLASLLDRCLTTLVTVGKTTTLFTQCSPVVDFKF